MERQELIRRLIDLRPALEAEGVKHVALFGSRARGDNNANSDIDLLLDVEAGSKFSLLNLVGVEHLVTDRTGIVANAFMRRSLDDGFRAAIRADLVEVF